MTLAVGTRLGPYKIAGSLGAGGMGEVYRATDTKLGRQVAIKILPDAFTSDPDRVARFEREARVLASLNHPHIAAIYGLEESGERKFLVMELVEGPTLTEHIAGSGLRTMGSGLPKPEARSPKPGRGLPIDEALRIAQQIGEALEAAHERGIVHRDLKPANVKLTPENSQAARFRFGQGIHE
jgi:serine/threonine protein kinase